MNYEDYMMPCMTKKLFGIDCFGCGIQRALTLIIQGNFEGAFYMYPAIYTMLIFFAAIGLNYIDKKRNYHYIIVTFGIITAIIMVISYFYKLFNY
jgi:hypothetical protein